MSVGGGGGGGGGQAHQVLTCREVVCLSSEYGMSGDRVLFREGARSCSVLW